jgi:hypothetical protein
MDQRPDPDPETIICLLGWIFTLCIAIYAFWWAGQPSVLR